MTRLVQCCSQHAEDVMPASTRKNPLQFEALPNHCLLDAHALKSVAASLQAWPMRNPRTKSATPLPKEYDVPEPTHRRGGRQDARGSTICMISTTHESMNGG